MPTYDITSPDGKTYEVTAPEGATQDQVLQYVQQQHAAVAGAPAKPPMSFGDKLNNAAAGVNNAMYSIPQSLMELAARGTDALGLSHGAYPGLHKEFMDAREMAAPVGTADPNSGAFKGGEIAGQVAATLPLGGMNLARGLASKIPALEAAAANSPRLAKLAGGIANGVAQGTAGAALTSNSSDAPLGGQLGLGATLGGMIPVAGAGLRGIGGKALPLLLGETTGGGAKAVKNAFTSGIEGGASGDAFRQNLRDPSSWMGVVDDVKGALQKMKLQRSQAYRSGMTDISKDATVLDFAPVDKALEDANAVNSFKGKDLAGKTTDVRKELNDAITDWKKEPAADFHTPEGFDALKQKIGDIRDAQQYGTPQWKAANDVYSSIRKTIADQAPAYDKVMKDYSEASDQLSSLTKEFSLGNKGNPNTALKKLQSIMRDNANTSWGNRVVGGQTLEDAGATNLMSKLSGQALSSPLPRGLNKMADAAALMLSAPALMAAPIMSPRLVGEGAHAAGRAIGGTGRALNAAGLDLSKMPKLSLATLLGSTAPGLLLANQN